MCTHSIDDLLPHAPLHYAATGEMVKCSLLYKPRVEPDTNFNAVSMNYAH